MGMLIVGRNCLKFERHRKGGEAVVRLRRGDEMTAK